MNLNTYPIFSTGIRIKLPIRDYDPVKRLKECERALDEAKSSVQPILGKYLLVLGGSLTTGLASLVGKNKQMPIRISNFPVGTNQYELMDRKMLHITIGAGGQVGVTGE